MSIAPNRAHLDTATNGDIESRSAGLRPGVSGSGSRKGAGPEAGAPVAVSRCAPPNMASIFLLVIFIFCSGGFSVRPIPGASRPESTANGKPPFCLCACIGTMNPPPTLPGGEQHGVASSPPGRGQGWVCRRQVHGEGDHNCTTRTLLM